MPAQSRGMGTNLRNGIQRDRVARGYVGEWLTRKRSNTQHGGTGVRFRVRILRRLPTQGKEQTLSYRTDSLEEEDRASYGQTRTPSKGISVLDEHAKRGGQASEDRSSAPTGPTEVNTENSAAYSFDDTLLHWALSVRGETTCHGCSTRIVSSSKQTESVDTDAMIAAIYGTDDLSLAGIRNALYTQQHNFDDFEGQMVNPFVMDAVEMAIKSGQLDKEIGRIIHSGPDTPGYDQAMRQAMRVGKPLVNQAAKRQIEINEQAGHGFRNPNLPFVETAGDSADWNLDDEYHNGATSTVNARKEGKGKRRGQSLQCSRAIRHQHNIRHEQ